MPGGLREGTHCAEWKAPTWTWDHAGAGALAVRPGGLRSTTKTKATVCNLKRYYPYRHGEPRSLVQSTGDDDDDDQVNRSGGHANGTPPLLELGIVGLAWVLTQKGRLYPEAG